MNNLLKFKNELYEMYNKYNNLFQYFENESYVKFLYSHMNDTIIIISPEKISGDFIICNKLKVNTNYTNNINLIYNKYLTDSEKNIINTGEFYVYIAETTYPPVRIDATEADKFFMLKNRRDYLIPMFFHQLTINTFSNLIIENIDEYINNKKKFFKLLVNIRKYIRTKERLGTMLDNKSFHNNNILNTIDLVVLHPRYDNTNIIKNLIDLKKLYFINPYFYNINEWKNKDKYTLDKNIKTVTNNKVNDYHDLIFDPNYHFYFFGLKIVA